MVAWQAFAEDAPRMAEVFVRRHAATGNLCLLATLRADGYPRISPMEPRIFEGQLVLVGMPGTTKFQDLGRDPRFCLHTATVDPNVSDGDVKLWGGVMNLQDAGLQSDSPTTCSRSPGWISGGRSSTRSTSPTSGALHRCGSRTAS